MTPGVHAHSEQKGSDGLVHYIKVWGTTFVICINISFYRTNPSLYDNIMAYKQSS